MDYGMSRLGRVTYRESRRPMFLAEAEELAGDRTHSEQTAREIDEEIRRIVAAALERVRHILEIRRKALIALAERLIEQETIDNGELKEIIEAASPSPMIVPGTEEPASRRAVEESLRGRRRRKPQAEERKCKLQNEKCKLQNGMRGETRRPRRRRVAPIASDCGQFHLPP